VCPMGLVVECLVADEGCALCYVQVMTRYYAELFKLNQQLVAEYNKRVVNHQALLDSLKDVNHMIQKASNLRMGSAKTRVVTDCRAAIKTNNVQSLFQIVSTGQNVRVGAR
jgi:Bardet-Biedl syndrome 2 protein